MWNSILSNKKLKITNILVWINIKTSNILKQQKQSHKLIYSYEQLDNNWGHVENYSWQYISTKYKSLDGTGSDFKVKVI